MKEFIDKLIERLEERRNKFALQQCIDYAEGLTDGYEGSIRIVNELAEEYKGGWIPCSERLPKSKVDVLVWDSDQEIHCVAWLNLASKIWYSNDFDIENSKNIVAWMPLPAPYTEGE